LTPEPSNNPEKTRPFLPHRPVFKETPAGDIYTPTRSKFKETFQRQNAVRRKKLFFYTLTKMSNPHASEDPSTSNHALTGLKNGASSVRSNINDEKAIAMDLENNEINGGTLFNKGEHLLEKHQMETSTRSSSASFSLSSLSSLPPLRCFLSPRASFSFVSDCNINDEYKNIQIRSPRKKCTNVAHHNDDVDDPDDAHHDNVAQHNDDVAHHHNNAEQPEQREQRETGQNDLFDSTWPG
jgi:hypothetical protein